MVENHLKLERSYKTARASTRIVFARTPAKYVRLEMFFRLHFENVHPSL